MFRPPPRKPWWDAPGVPWYAGLMSEAEAEEREAQGRIKLAIAEYLNRPRPRRVTLQDHGPWNQMTLTCLTCHRSQLELHKDMRMPECQGQ